MRLPNIFTDDIINNLGSPTSVLARALTPVHADEKPHYDLMLIYDGLIVSTDSDGWKPNMEGPFDLFEFFPARIPAKDRLPWGDVEIVPWQGLQTFEYYCRDYNKRISGWFLIKTLFGLTRQLQPQCG
jgi:hypothetical protein